MMPRGVSPAGGFVLGLSIVGVILSGCAQVGNMAASVGVNMPGGIASAPTPLENLAGQDAIGPAIAAGAVAAGVASISGANDTESAAIGIFTAVATYTALEIANERRKAYATELAYIESEIAVANTALAKKKDELQQARTETTRVERLVKKLEADKRRNMNVAEEARRERDNLQRLNRGYEATLKGYEKALSYIDDVQASSVAKPGDDPKILKARLETLATRERDLRRQFAELSGIKERTEFAEGALNSLATN